MGKTIFAAVISSILASIATVLVMGSFQSERRAEEAKARETAEATAKVEYDRIVRRVTELEKRPAAPQRVERRGSPDEAETKTDGTVAAPAPATAALAPDGTPYVSRAELEEFAKSRGGAVTNAVATEAKAAEAKSLEDIAREQNLSAAEEANIRNILRETEEEMVRCLFGDKPIADVTRDVLAAKDDPDKQAELMQTVIQNALPNIGKLATVESRTKKRVVGVLGEERGKKFLDAPRKPVLAPEFEEFFNDFGD